MGSTLVEKIAQRFAINLPDGHTVQAGDFLTIKPFHVLTHDNTSAVIPKFRSMGAKKVLNPDQPVYALDHDIQNDSPENLKKYETIKSFAAENGVSFYPAGRGIGHQVMLEEGYVLPGTFCCASDSHSNIYGALGALGTPVVRTDAAAIWATGRTWWQVPDIVKVHLTGEMQPCVSGKDVIIALIGTFNKDEVLNCCVEFTGPGVAKLRIDERMAISNMTTEWGALAGVFPFDAVTKEYLLSRAKTMAERGDAKPAITEASVAEIEKNALHADADAFYSKVLEFDLSAVTPFVAGPNEVKKITPLPEIEAENVKIHRAFILSCVNGRLEDFTEAASILKGKKVADGVKLYIAAASDEIEAKSKELGDWDAMISAGAIPLPPGCGPCIGLGDGVLGDGEVGISATNRNFKGRMGSRDSFVYLASPAVVAASAVAGKIAQPPRHGDASPAELRAKLTGASKVTINERPGSTAQSVKILDGFPTKIEGELLLIPQDNLNTDGIYGKEFTYTEGLSPEEMGTKAMLNYDPKFQDTAKEGDLLLGGYNFGSGSSREQAATALKFRGMQMIVAGSYSQTYKRNAFNNGYVVIECPQLVDDIRKAQAGNADLTIRTGVTATVDFTTGNITAGEKTYTFSPLGEVAQELIVKGGFEAVIRDQLAEMA